MPSRGAVLRRYSGAPVPFDRPALDVCNAKWPQSLHSSPIPGVKTVAKIAPTGQSSTISFLGVSMGPPLRAAPLSKLPLRARFERPWLTRRWLGPAHKINHIGGDSGFGIPPQLAGERVKAVKRELGSKARQHRVESAPGRIGWKPVPKQIVEMFPWKDHCRMSGQVPQESLSLAGFECYAFGASDECRRT